MSLIVITGNFKPYGSPSASLRFFGPNEPIQPPKTLAQMIKYFSVSTAFPGPTAVLHQPFLLVTGLISATN